jgi:hypothetical protein
MEFGRARQGSLPFLVFLEYSTPAQLRGQGIEVFSWLMAQIPFLYFPQKYHIFFYSLHHSRKTWKCYVFVQPVILAYRTVWPAIHRNSSRYDQAHGRSYQPYTAAHRLAEFLAGITGLVASMTGHTLNSQNG